MATANATRNAAAKKMASPKPRGAAAGKSPAKKAAPAKKAVAKTGQRGRSKPRSAQPLAQSAQDALARLLYQSCLDRGSRETSVSDVVVLRPNETLPLDSTEMQTVTALGAGNIAAMVATAQGSPVAPGAAVGAVAGAAEVALTAVDKVKVVRRLGTAMALEADAEALLAIRRTNPGLKMAPAALLYPQYVRALGDELSALEVKVTPGVPATRVPVRVTDSATQQPVKGAAVRGLLDFGGRHVSARTDANGVAVLVVPNTAPTVEIVMVEPDHTYWSRFSAGFQRATAPAQLEVTVTPLLADTFRLMSGYAAYDANAGMGVKVGVIDTGVGPHDDLVVLGGACLVTGEQSTDFTDNGVGHGTHVAGIIAARRSALSGEGVYGLAPACILMSYRVCPRLDNPTAREQAKSVDVAAAIEKAIVDQCDFVNISLGSTEAMPEVPAVLEEARNAGMVVFAATGNDSKDSLRYPARYSHALAVGALGRKQTSPEDSPAFFTMTNVTFNDEFVASFSNHGMGTDFIGVGVAVLSTYPNNRYAMMSGTSMATPYLTGMAARLLAQAPNLLNMPRDAHRADAIINMLCDKVRQPQFTWPNIYSGFGVLTGAP